MNFRALISRTSLMFFGFGVALGMPLGIATLLISTHHSENRSEERFVRQMDDVFQPTFADMIRRVAGPDYSVYMASGSEPLWWPVNVVTDGVKTYIQFKNKEVVGWTGDGKPAAPNLIVVESLNGNSESWSYRIVDDVMVIDAVISKALLVSPDKIDTVVVRLNHNGANK